MSNRAPLSKEQQELLTKLQQAVGDEAITPNDLIQAAMNFAAESVALSLYKNLPRKNLDAWLDAAMKVFREQVILDFEYLVSLDLETAQMKGSA